jgi:tetratricopeptide (TPR) repeat protein
MPTPVLLLIPTMLFCTLISSAQSNGYSDVGQRAEAALMKYQKTGNGNDLTPGINLLAQQPRKQLTPRDLIRYLQLLSLRHEKLGKQDPTFTNDLREFFDLTSYVKSTADLPQEDRAKFWNMINQMLPDYVDFSFSKIQNEEFFDAEEHLKISRQLLEMGNISDSWSNKEIHLDTLYLNVLIGTGYTHTQLQQWQKAAEVYQKVNQRFPSEKLGWTGYLKTLIALKQFHEAESVLQQAKKRFPSDTELLFTEMNVFLASNQWKKALTQIDQLIQLEPGNESLYTTKASLLEQELSTIPVNKITASQRDKVDRAYQEATQKFPMSEDAWYSYGTFYYNMYANLTSMLAKTSEDDPTLERITADARKILIEKGLPAFKRVQQLNPKDINSLIALSNIYQMQDNTTELKRVSERLNLLKDGKKPNSSLY